ncbi:MAG: hypothetical protein Q9209_003528 [Squamulea sp. 1 TL-2023]
MASQDPPRNRKERRAQAQQQSNPAEIPLAHPKQQGPTGKTLIDIAEERQLLQKSSDGSPSIITTQINPDGSITEIPEPSVSSDPISTPYLDILLYSTSLILLHFTLSLLVHHQYDSERPSILSVLLSSTAFSPAPWLILLLVALLHPRASHPLMQLVFASMAVVAGCWLVQASNEDPYMAVMKKAPALGTLWVWGIVELRWEVAAACLAVTGGWGGWKGFSYINPFDCSKIKMECTIPEWVDGDSKRFKFDQGPTPNPISMAKIREHLMEWTAELERKVMHQEMPLDTKILKAKSVIPPMVNFYRPSILTQPSYSTTKEYQNVSSLALTVLSMKQEKSGAQILPEQRSDRFFVPPMKHIKGHVTRAISARCRMASHVTDEVSLDGVALNPNSHWRQRQLA